MSMMNDWNDYNRIHTEINKGNTDKPSKPSVIQYLGIKLVDNWILIVLIVFVVFFTMIGISNKDNDKIGTWVFHAAGLCLGVFLGLFKKNN